MYRLEPWLRLLFSVLGQYSQVSLYLNIRWTCVFYSERIRVSFYQDCNLTFWVTSISIGWRKLTYASRVFQKALVCGNWWKICVPLRFACWIICLWTKADSFLTLSFVPFSKMCFRAWFHDTKLEIHNRKKEERIVAKHFMMWKKRIDLNSIATEMVRLSNCIALSVAELRGRILGLY